MKIKSGFRYVNWYSKGKKWRAQLHTGKNNLFLGHFEDVKDARDQQVIAERLLNKSVNMEVDKETAMQAILDAYRANQVNSTLGSSTMLGLARKAMNVRMYSLAYVSANHAIELSTS